MIERLTKKKPWLTVRMLFLYQYLCTWLLQLKFIYLEVTRKNNKPWNKKKSLIPWVKIQVNRG